jgi:hypothetical protein
MEENPDKTYFIARAVGANWFKENPKRYILLYITWMMSWRVNRAF